MIDFEDEQLLKLRKCFDSLADVRESSQDPNEEKALCVDDLEDPLIALGLVENRQQVQQIVQLVDEDGSEMIEFDEFLQIIQGGSKVGKGSGGGNEGAAIYDFF